MPQNINLNVAPYYDDFDAEKNYHRVLFKPGYSVQARELTTLQSILQNQIERFGQNIFKDGSMVIPGNVGYDFNYTCVEINNVHLGIPVGDYIQSLVGATIKGEVSNILARVENVLTESQSERSNNTLYIKYLSSNTINFTETSFIDGENLIIQEDVQYPNGILNQGNTICTTISNDSTSIGSAVKLSSGIYFVRGFFINVDDQTLILDQYTNNPSYRIGLFIKESFTVASNENSDLLDNSQGFYNFAAPGADRLSIEAELIKKPLDSFNDENFVQLLKVEDGIVTSIVDNTEYNKILDEIAKRTYDESGDYYITPFQIDIKESLNDYIGNNGIYSSEQITKNGNIPSNNFACLSISPGKAYVRGYEVEKISNTLLDYEKPRDTETLNSEAIQFNFGTKFELNNVYGYIPVGLSSSSYVKLYDRKTDTVGVSTGNLIGVARIYDLKLKSSTYENESSIFDISLFDIQTHTKLTISSGFSTSLNKSAHIQGKNSGANGFLVSGISTTTVSFDLKQVSGNFIVNEPLIVNGVDTNRIIKSIKDYTINDARQITSYETSPAKFTADFVLSRRIDLANNRAPFTISSVGSGTISTITSSNSNFYLNIDIGDVISYTKPGDILPTYNVITSVGTTNLTATIEALQSTPNVNVGTLPSSTITVTDLKKVTSNIINNNTKLYSKLNHNNISSLELSNSNIYLRKTIGPITIGNSSVYEVSVFEGSLDSFLVPFDEEAYTLTYSDGSIESLTEQKLIPNLDSSNNPAQGRITLRNLSSASLAGDSYLTVTYRKLNISTRQKTYNRCSTLTINNTRSGINTTNTGLTVSSIFGRRIEDNTISLNVPEVYSIVGIFESSNQGTPVLPSVVVSSISGNIANLIKGEKIVGETSKAVALLVETNLSTQINFCYLNDKNFIPNETLKFEESRITAVVGSVSIGDKNIKNNYILDNGSRDSYFDFSRIIRKPGAESPRKKITIVFNSYSIDSNDSGTFVGVNSYDLNRYMEIPVVNSTRFTDILDFRPRVEPYNTNSTYSPFDFESRVFNLNSSSSNAIVAKDYSIDVSYNYYLPRTDKLVLTKEGEFRIVKGIPSLYPKRPSSLDYSLDVATIYSPAYVFDLKDIKIDVNTHKRYTMKDISVLEDRLKKVETHTYLSTLEREAQTLPIIDAVTNLNRFKVGFFVDNFKDPYNGDINDPLYRASIDLDDGLLRPEPYSTFVDLDANLSTSSNIKKTGNLLTLNYNSVVYIDNPFATKAEKINPFGILDWKGTIQLNPPTDSWIETSDDSSTSQWGEWDNWANGSININEEQLNQNRNLYIRSRNIGIKANCLKQKTEFYAFLDDVNVTNYVVPKLIEVELITGSFSVGETVEGVYGNSSIIFRVAKLNHKSGSYDNPSDIYLTNPYTDVVLASDYSSSSNIVNIDIESLSLNSNTNFFGSLSENMILKGSTSGAVARVKKVRIITDDSGSFNGSLYIPDSKISSNPKFKVGTKTFILSTSSTNSVVNSSLESYAETSFTATGNIQNVERNYLNIRNNRLISDYSNDINIDSEFNVSLAQAFFVPESSGIFVTKCTVYFKNKDSDVSNIPVTLQIRTIKNGKPTREVLPFSEVVLTPGEIDTSANFMPTDFVFESPVYLEGNKEYCIVLNTSSDMYTVWTSRIGEPISTPGLTVDEVASQVSNVGYLFKSQRTSILNPSQYESMRFTLFRANFIGSTGVVDFYNPNNSSTYNTNQITKLDSDSIQTYSRSLSVDLNRNLSSSEITLLNSGYTLTQASNTTFSSKVKSITGKLNLNYNLNIVNPGYGYTVGITSYTNVDLVTLTGSGSGAKATIGVGTGSVYFATITTQGKGYSNGDVLTIDYKDTNNLGSSVILSVPSSTGILTAYNSLILDEVQGSPTVSNNNLIMNGTTLSGAYPSDTPTVLTDGLHIKIKSKNHGMYSQNNIVRISGVQSDVPPTTLVSNVTTTSTVLLVNDASNFVLFEDSAVGAGNTGYVRINNEIIGYSGVNTTSTPNEITINTTASFSRGVDNTISTLHFNGDTVFKYEFNSISLRNINKQHLLTDVDYSKYSIDLDEYYVKISSPNQRYFGSNKSGGIYASNLGAFSWNSPRATKNIAYSILRPIVNVITPGGSSISSQIRTFSSTSADGNETSYQDKGFEAFSLTADNSFNSIRGIFSRENEMDYINSSTNNSLTLKLNLSTTNSKVSPVIDLEKVGVIPIMNRINQPITNYFDDSRINSLQDDPNAAIYVTKKIPLARPSDGLRVIFDAYRHQTNDIRVAYKIFRADVEDEIQLYELFPGYGNIDSLGNTIDSSKNSGLADVLVTPSSTSDEFKTYEYNVKIPYIFTGFQIKIVMTGTNQAYVPKIKNLRVIATI